METVANFSFTASEIDAEFECSLDDEPFTGCSSPEEYTDLASGRTPSRCAPFDADGNADSTPESYTWLIEAVPDTDRAGDRASP